MPATRIHLVRHGEVENPDGVLYGRLPNFPLSDLGHQMAEAAAKELRESGANITRLISSPLERAIQSANPIAKEFNVPIEIEERIIESSNIFEGHAVSFKTLVRNPRLALALYNPLRPSWGEAFKQIAGRMAGAMEKVWYDTPVGEVVMVSHQLPIWAVHLFASEKPLWHNPRNRRCELSSITSFEMVGEDNKLVEVGYRDPAKNFRVTAVDRGAA